MTDKDKEQLLVVSTKKLFPDGPWEGFRIHKKSEIFKLIESEGKYLARGKAEKDPKWQQIIPQIALIVGKKIFIHKIPVSGNEDRLHEMWPIFLGGHVNDLDDGIEGAVSREFEEEIDYKGKIIKKEFLGLVKLNSPEVNAVHTGLVWVYVGNSEKFESTDDNGLTDGKFVPIEDLGKYIDKMSYWSKEVAPFLIARYS